MPNYIVKLKNRYCEWSTVVDAPVSALLDLEVFKTYYIQKYGTSAAAELEDRLTRVEERGTSTFNMTLDELIAGNSAGADESELSLEEIYTQYADSEDTKER